MNTHLPAVPHGLPAVPHSYQGRRHNDNPYMPPPHHHQTHHGPYNNYHQGPPNHQHHPSQAPMTWYPPYQQMSTPPPRQYQPHSPLVVSSYPASNPAPSVAHNSAPRPPSSSAHSQAVFSPPQSAGSLHVPTPPPTAPTSSSLLVTPLPSKRSPFYPPVSSVPDAGIVNYGLTAQQLPWYSVPEEPFPPRAAQRRRKRRAPQSTEVPLELPSKQQLQVDTTEAQLPESSKATLPAPSELGTPVTSQATSEIDSTHPTTPSSALPPQSAIRTPPTSTPKANGTKPSIPAVPIAPVIPIVPAIPKYNTRQSVSTLPSTSKGTGAAASQSPPANGGPVISPDQSGVEAQSPSSEQTSTTASPPPKIVPKTWADLVKTKAPKNSPQVAAPASTSAVQPNGIVASSTGTLADALSSFGLEAAASKLSFLEPRGLVNTGNMCYMNSILQILAFCVPFYEFLDQVGKRAAHSFKSDTPLVDAMIMFMREYPVIDSAVSVDQLRMRLKDSELEQYGEAFIPEFVYEVIRRLPRFSTMRRGHQQDAEEFLGFLLEGLHDECAQVMKARSSASSTTSGISTPTNGLISPSSEPLEATKSATDGGWLEVGPKQKAAITRSSGTIVTESPITKIFGGKLRSELRIPGVKPSVTLEPYQPLQLDIGSPSVYNITDALKGLTRSETLQGDFNSPRGPGVTATKQVFMETLPPVLILHLKRFQYDNTGGTQKIWKKIGYPLELEIPKEVFPPHKRGGLTAHGGLPKYRLIGVVYHHGKNASGGHYTVDVRRQEGREWIRIDDTVIRRLRTEDVAEGGSEEDPKVAAAVLENHQRDKSASGNIFEQVGIDGEDGGADDQGWSQISGTSTPQNGGAKKWSKVVNGSTTPTNGPSKKTPAERFSIKDNKVAYILFYQKINA
ncbi:MAG: hypothetical protein M1812_005257 [Candelaria pacifica]|nr:MAG: hypothetical protein M1812_005257 [Candelaria pacifica]